MMRRKAAKNRTEHPKSIGDMEGLGAGSLPGADIGIRYT
jgi:hypothetical protein